MSFQDQLDGELKKRGLVDEQNEEVVSSLPPTSKFSIRSCLIGLFLISMFMGILVAWAQLNSRKTQENLVKRLPSKTTIIQQMDEEVFRMSDSQRLSMQSAAKEDSQTLEEQTKTQAIMSEEDKAIKAFIQENEGGAPEKEETVSLEIRSPPVESVTSKPYQLYKKEFINTTKPNLSIIVTDLGLSRARTEELIESLPENVTLALSPYSEYLEELTTAAREKGHEVWMMLPIQTQDYPLVDSGPLTLLSDASIEQNQNRIDTLISLSTGQAGFIPQKNHSFNIADGNINPAIKKLFSSGYAMIDSNVSGRSFVSDISYKEDYPNAQNNFWLDDNLTPLALNQKLRQIMELAEARGDAIIMMRPYPASLLALDKFLNSAAAKKFELSPASASLKNAG